MRFCPPGRPRRSSWLLLDQCSCGLCGHLSSEPMDTRSFSRFSFSKSTFPLKIFNLIWKAGPFRYKQVKTGLQRGRDGPLAIPRKQQTHTGDGYHLKMEHRFYWHTYKPQHQPNIVSSTRSKAEQNCSPLRARRAKVALPAHCSRTSSIQSTSCC